MALEYLLPICLIVIHPNGKVFNRNAIFNDYVPFDIKCSDTRKNKLYGQIIK